MGVLNSMQTTNEDSHADFSNLLNVMLTLSQQNKLQSYTLYKKNGMPEWNQNQVVDSTGLFRKLGPSGL